MMPLMKTFSRPEISGWKPAPSSISAEMRPLTATVPLVGLVIPATSFSSVLLPEPLRPMTPSVRPVGTVKVTSHSAGEGFVRLEVADQAARQQRALQRRELPPAAVSPVDLRGVVTSMEFMIPASSFQLPASQLRLSSRVRQLESWQLAAPHTSSANVSRSRSKTSSRTGSTRPRRAEREQPLPVTEPPRRTGSPDTTSPGA